MVKKDLKAVGIAYETEAGIADFHAAGRASHITEMLRQGANMVQVMKQARHSDIRMTMRYFKADLSDQVTAIQSLPLPANVSQQIVSSHCGGACPEAAENDTTLRKKQRTPKTSNPGTDRGSDASRKPMAEDGNDCHSSPDEWRRRELVPECLSPTFRMSPI